MAISIVRLGSPRGTGEGLRIGTVRRPPRGVKKQDFAKRDFYDVWLPDLAPSTPLIKLAHRDWKRFAKGYRREMQAQSRMLDVLSALSVTSDFSVGCYCEDESRCHRSILRELLAEHGARIAK